MSDAAEAPDAELPTSHDALTCPWLRQEWRYQNQEGRYADREPAEECEDE